jgi:hypothetical protein
MAARSRSGAREARISAKVGRSLGNASDQVNSDQVFELMVVEGKCLV